MSRDKRESKGLEIRAKWRHMSACSRLLTEGDQTVGKESLDSTLSRE